MTQRSFVSGGAEVERVLRALPDAMRRRVLDSATRAGANVLRKEIRARAPRGKAEDRARRSKKLQGVQLAKEIKVTRDRASGLRGVRMVVHTGRAFWALFSEFGRVGQAAKPFFRPGFEAAADAAFRRMAEILRSGLEREAGRLASREGRGLFRRGGRR